MKRLKAAAVQIAPDLTTGTGTIDRVCDAIDRAASQGVELAVFPETFIPYYPYFSFVAPAVLMGKDHLRLYEWAVEVPGPVTARLSKVAAQHGMVLVVGVNERDGGSLYNTQLIFDNDGRLLLKRRKITPTYHERMVWGQGDGAGIRAVETAVGRVGGPGLAAGGDAAPVLGCGAGVGSGTFSAKAGTNTNAPHVPRIIAA